MIHLDFPHVSKPQATVLALWSVGMVLARSCTLPAVATFLAAWLRRQEQTVWQQLRAFCDEAGAKRGDQRGARPRRRRGGVGPITQPRPDDAPGLAGPMSTDRTARPRLKRMPRRAAGRIMTDRPRHAEPGLLRWSPPPPRRVNATAASHRRGGSSQRDRRQCIGEYHTCAGGVASWGPDGP